MNAQPADTVQGSRVVEQLVEIVNRILNGAEAAWDALPKPNAIINNGVRKALHFVCQVGKRLRTVFNATFKDATVGSPSPKVW